LQAAVEGNEALALEDSPPDSDGERLGTRAESDAHDEMMRNQPARPRTLPEVIEEQLLTVELEPELLAWVRFLVGCIDDTGYLSAADDELLGMAAACGLARGEAMLGQAIGTLQSLEPRGVGARNAVEALLLQLNAADPDYAQLCQLLEEFLEELARNKLPRVAQAMGLEMDELLRLLEVLRALDCRPLGNLVEGGTPRIEPEIVVEWGENGHEVSLPRSRLPAVTLDSGVLEAAADSTQSKDTRQYLRGRIDQARWIVQAVEQRRATILRVAAAVFARQSAFLSQGPGHLVPLKMGEIAEALGVHVSTVSRAVAGKHVQTPWGLLALRSFFQSTAGGGTGSTERGAARDEVRERVRAIVEREDPSSPQSDDEIVAALALEGLTVARRTVAKYRGELGIPSSYRRRKYGQSSGQ
jgi:RNA polymerase sigma-54 factor